MESSASVCLPEIFTSDLDIPRIDRIHFIGYNVGRLLKNCVNIREAARQRRILPGGNVE